MITNKNIEQSHANTDKPILYVSQIKKEHIDLAIQFTYNTFYVRTIRRSLYLLFDLVNDIDCIPLNYHLSQIISKRIKELIAEDKVMIIGIQSKTKNLYKKKREI
jgi:hypothetical protein